MPISFDTYARVALEDQDEQWELVCRRLRRKPAMTIEHDGAAWRLIMQLVRQLAEDSFLVSHAARVRISSGSFYIPDLCVIPVTMERRIRRERPGELAVLDEPLPLVVEVWSPSSATTMSR
jgi:Uma2 family endonuclease